MSIASIPTVLVRSRSTSSLGLIARTVGVRSAWRPRCLLLVQVVQVHRTNPWHVRCHRWDNQRSVWQYCDSVHRDPTASPRLRCGSRQIPPLLNPSRRHVHLQLRPSFRARTPVAHRAQSSTRIVRTHDRSCHAGSERWSPSIRSAACIIATSASPPNSFPDSTNQCVRGGRTPSCQDHLYQDHLYIDGVAISIRVGRFVVGIAARLI